MRRELPAEREHSPARGQRDGHDPYHVGSGVDLQTEGAEDLAGRGGTGGALEVLYRGQTAQRDVRRGA